MEQFLLIIGLTFIGYKFVINPYIIKPFITNPFLDGYNNKTSKPSSKKRNNSNEISKKKGDKFEQYIVKKFDKGFFKMKEWRGDKYIDGLYAESNMNPDLEYEFILNSFSSKFALECKFRQNLYNREVELAKERQIQIYKKFELERQIPVYIALGLGGNPEKPAELFLIPLKCLSTNKISYESLLKFKKETDGHFYFNIQDKLLY